MKLAPIKSCLPNKVLQLSEVKRSGSEKRKQQVSKTPKSTKLVKSNTKDKAINRLCSSSDESETEFTKTPKQIVKKPGKIQNFLKNAAQKIKDLATINVFKQNFNRNKEKNQEKMYIKKHTTRYYITDQREKIPSVTTVLKNISNQTYFYAKNDEERSKERMNEGTLLHKYCEELLEENEKKISY